MKLPDGWPWLIGVPLVGLTALVGFVGALLTMVSLTDWHTTWLVLGCGVGVPIALTAMVVLLARGREYLLVWRIRREMGRRR